MAILIDSTAILITVNCNNHSKDSSILYIKRSCVEYVHYVDNSSKGTYVKLGYDSGEKLELDVSDKRGADVILNDETPANNAALATALAALIL